jgi:ribosomal protein S18 acetylase RimI-like enzyme
MSLSIDILNSKKHDRSSFACGITSLDEYIKTRASQELRKRVSTPFVLTDSPSQQVLGYYCLSSYSVEAIEIEGNIAQKLPRYPLLPAILLGRLAVDNEHRGKGYGDLLISDALKRALLASSQVSSVAVVVDATNQDAVNFYLKYGFTEFQTDPIKLYILLDEIEKSI